MIVLAPALLVEAVGRVLFLTQVEGKAGQRGLGVEGAVPFRLLVTIAAAAAAASKHASLRQNRSMARFIIVSCAPRL